VAKVAGLGGAENPGQIEEDFVDDFHLGDAIRFFLDAKRAGGRSERTTSEYRKKLDLFQRWAGARLESRSPHPRFPVRGYAARSGSGEQQRGK